MLSSLLIHNIVLIDKLNLSFENGLCVLTGETGAGKSILLDSLALALGARADLGLIRGGQDRGSVTAEFSLPVGHPAFKILEDLEFSEGEPLILRRIISSDGRNRATINDQSVSASLLRTVGDSLVEIHGQNAERGFLDAKGHLKLLDIYSKLESTAKLVSKQFASMQKARVTQDEVQSAIRGSGIANVTAVEAVVLETDG
ncbi:MAG: AAA family ATPase, partial [Sneathiella sp.]|nr:AAA family ATPase [Sneathiella sp.]